MADLEIAKERHAEYIKRQEKWLRNIAEDYDCDLDEDSEDGLEELLNMIREGDMQLSGSDDRDGVYIEDVLRCNETLIIALKALCNADKKVQHNGKRNIQSAIKNARAIKSSREEDIRKAQEVINVMDEIISVCEKYN